MGYNPERYHRRSIRLKGYDYSCVGTYFVTICTWQRECLFGEVVDTRVQLNDVGRKAQQCWEEIPVRFPSVTLDDFVVMPNHIHGILLITRDAAIGNVENEDKDGRRGAACCAQIVASASAEGAASSAPTLGQIVRVYKSISAISINRLQGRSERPAWQRNYYEHIIRDDDSLNRIRLYIAQNPSLWSDDTENPANATIR